MGSMDCDNAISQLQKGINIMLLKRQSVYLLIVYIRTCSHGNF